MSYNATGIIVIVLMIFGFILYLGIEPNLKNEILSNLCTLIFVINTVLYLSFIICINISYNHSNIYFSTYDIDKLTKNRVYFTNDLGEEKVIKNITNIVPITEDISKENINKVVVKKKYYTVNWLWKASNEQEEYFVYLSEDVYVRYKNQELIYLKGR